MDKHYLIDYENVHERGLAGADRFTEADHIHLFYTDNVKNAPIDFFNNHGKAELQIIKTPVGKQSLDVHLMSYLGYLIGQHGTSAQYVIISADTDYDKVARFWRERMSVVICRRAKLATPKVVEKQSPVEKKTVEKKTAEKKLTEKKQGGKKQIEKKTIVKKSVEKKQPTASPELESKVQQNTPETKNIKEEIKVSDKTRLNQDIQKALSKGLKGENPDIPNEVASFVVKNSMEKGNKQHIYRSMVQKYGQKLGLTIYSLIKGML